MMTLKRTASGPGFEVGVWPALLLLIVALAEFGCARSLAQVASEASKGVLPVKPLARKTTVDFEREILPLLKANCLACHNKTTTKADLILETPATILKGGESGPAVVPGKSAESLLFKLATHEAKPRMPPKENKVSAVDFTPEQLGLIQLWIDQGAKGEVRGEIVLTWQPLPSSLKGIYAVAVSPDATFAACARGNRISVYDLGRQALGAKLSGEKAMALPEVPPKHPALVRERAVLVSTTQGTGRSRLPPQNLRGSERDLEQTLAANPHRDWVNALCFSPDGERLASAGYREVRIWSRLRPTLVREMKKVGEDAAMATVSAKGRFAAVCGAKGSVQVFDLASGKSIWRKGAHKGRVAALNFATGEDRLLTVGDDGLACLWETSSGRLISVVKLSGKVSSGALFGESAGAVFGFGSGAVQVWSLAKIPAGNPDVDFVAHTNSVTVVEVSADGSRLLTGGADGSVGLWELANGKLVQRFQHGTPLSAAVFGPDAKRVASAAEDGSLKVWELGKKEPVFEGRGYRELLIAQWTAERTARLATNTVAYSKGVVQSSTNELNGQLERHKKAVEAVAAAEKSDQEKRVALDKANGAKATAAAALEAFEKQSKSVAESLETVQKLVAAAVDGAKLAAEYKAYADKAQALVAEKRKPVTERSTEATKAADAAAAEQKKTGMASANAENERALAVTSVEKSRLALAVAEEVLRGSETGVTEATEAIAKAETAMKRAAKPVRSVAFAGDGKSLTTVDDAGTVQVWAMGAPRPIEAHQSSPGGARGAAVLEGGVKWVVVGADRSIRVWHRGLGWHLERVIAGTSTNGVFADRITALGFSPDGKFLATGGGQPSRGGEVKIWDVVRGTLHKDLTNVHSDVVFGLDFSPDGKLLATCSADRFAKVTDLSDGKILKTFEGHTDYVLSVRWRADGRGLATGGADGIVKVWDVATGDRKRNVDGATKEVTAVRFVGLADHTLSASGDAQLRVNNEKGEKLRSFDVGGDYLQSAEITTDGDRVVTGGGQGVLRVFDGSGKSMATFGPDQ